MKKSALDIMKTIKFTLITILLLAHWPVVHSNTAQALPPIISERWGQAKMIGQTSFRKYGFHIYDASYWLLERDSQGEPMKNSKALMIAYARNIKSEKLVASTEKQWNKIGVSSDYPVSQWLRELSGIWPDVGPGDLLIALVTPGGSTEFYSGDGLLGVIDDTQFGPVFLDIWLGSKSRYQKNRKELLNEG
jgi:hypothetical protein